MSEDFAFWLIDILTEAAVGARIDDEPRVVEWEARFDHLRIELLGNCGEAEMATLWTLDRDEYDAKAERGRIESLGGMQ